MTTPDWESDYPFATDALVLFDLLDDLGEVTLDGSFTREQIRLIWQRLNQLDGEKGK